MQAAFDELARELAIDLTRESLTPEYLESIGLGEKWIVLASDNKYVLYRNKIAAYVLCLADAKEYTISLKPYKKNKRMPFERYRAFVREIQKVDEGRFFEHLACTGIWDSINLESAIPRCYLSRISYALANRGDNIFWDKSLGELCDEQLEIMHLNRIPFCDVASNLKLARQVNHRAYDTEKCAEAGIDAMEQMLEVWWQELVLEEDD